MAEITMHVEGMTCGHCRETVTRALRAVDGVSAVQVDLEKGTAAVTYDATRTAPEALERAVTATGYRVGTATAAVHGRHGRCC